MPSRYAAAHSVENRKGPGDGRPTGVQVVKDEGLQGAMKDKVFFMTGCSSGIGIETARAVASTGARCFLGARSLKRAEEACKDFLEPGRVELIEIDVSSLSSVRTAASEFLSKSAQLNVLINNAAVMGCPQEKSVDGFELQLATNYLGHFLLYSLLEPTLLGSSTPSFHSRVVNVSSAGHHASSVHLDNLNLEGDGEYEPYKAYGQSKTAMVWMTNEIERRHGSKGLHGLSVMPGGIMTNLQKHVPEEMKEGWKNDDNVMKFMKSPAQGSSTTLIAAVGKDWEGKGGAYLEDCDTAIPMPPGGDMAVGYKPHIFEPDNEQKLWEKATKLVSVGS